MINIHPPLPIHKLVLYSYSAHSRWNISQKYDYWIERATGLHYNSYDDLPDDIRQHLILEIVKTRNTNINFSQFIDKSLRDEMACMAERQELHPKYPNRSCV